MNVKISDLSDDMIKAYNKYYRLTRAKIDNKYVWFEVMRNKADHITLTRKYSNIEPINAPDIKQIIEKWAGAQSITQNTYLTIETFGNGITFYLTTDLFNMLDDVPQLEINNVVIPEIKFFGRAGLGQCNMIKR